jgi:hypothetical protein
MIRKTTSTWTVPLVVIGTVVLLVTGSAVAVAHEDHGEPTPETPLEPSDGPDWPAHIAGAVAVTLLAAGTVYLGLAVVRRTDRNASTAARSLFGRVSQVLRRRERN